MKHFTITTEEQADALRPFAVARPKIGHIVHPSAGQVVQTAWEHYPESDAITFEQCMSIVNDVVTEEVLRELGEVGELGACKFVEIVGGQSRVARSKTPPHLVYLFIADDEDSAMTLIPNPTATKIRLLTSILRGQCTTAIERIKGFCTEVTQRQWDELVRVADEVGVKVWDDSRRDGTAGGFMFAQIDSEDSNMCLFHSATDRKRIPYPDFLAKLKGVEKWEPKNGEEVECRDGLGADWVLAKFIGYDGKWAICRPEHRLLGNYTTHNDANIRPLRPTITRAEAEAQLRKRIID